MKRRYNVQVTVVATLTVDDSVFKEVLNDDWRKQFYPFTTREEVVEHLAFNLLQERPLSSLDGFARLEDDKVTVTEVDWMDWEVEVSLSVK